MLNAIGKLHTHIHKNIKYNHEDLSVDGIFLAVNVSRFQDTSLQKVWMAG